MIVGLSFYSGDAEMAIRWLNWAKRLGGCQNFECVLIVDAGTPCDKVISALEIANTVFKSAHVTATNRTMSGWPKAPNLQWRTAMEWAAKNEQDMLFVEVDSVPLKPTWLEELNAAWNVAPEGTEYLGCIEMCLEMHLPPKVISGVGIYSKKVGKYPMVELGRAWNTDFSDLLIPHAIHSPLIKDFFGRKELPPVFVKERNEHSPANALTLDFIPPEAVIWHRDKSHSLVSILRKKLFNEETPVERGRIAVVFPVHAGDVGLANLHAQWLQRSQKKWAHRAVIVYDTICPAVMVHQLQARLRDCFENVEMFRYVAPRKPYPAAANHAWQMTARHMAAGKEPWLWFEADMSVISPQDWLDKLQAEYEMCNRSWMGAVVPGLGHLQGTAVYPADSAFRMPRAMSCPDHTAFDMLGREDAGEDVHDCGHLLGHVWTLLGDDPCPVNGGQMPMNFTLERARRCVKPGMVALHRVKDASLVTLLMNGWRP